MTDGMPTGFGSDNATLSAGFTLNFGQSFAELARMDGMLLTTAGNAVRESERVRQSLDGGFNLRPAAAAFAVSANGITKDIENVNRASERAEKRADGLARSIGRQSAEFGKTASEVRNMRVELAAIEADSRGLTVAAANLRAVNAEMNRLEAEAAGATGGVRKTGGAMAAMAPQAQDLATQVSMGGNVLNAFAIQMGQASTQLVHMEGAAGKVGAFLLGPWGLALTGAALVVGAMSDKLFGNSEASDKAAESMKKFQDRQSDIGSFIDMTTGKLIEQNRVMLINARITRDERIAANDRTIADARKEAFRIAGNKLDARGPTFVSPTTGGTMMQRTVDPEVQVAIRAANGDVGKLVTTLERLSTTRPDLRTLVRDLSGVAGGAILASRENENLRKELRGLSGDVTAFGKGNAAGIERRVALATANTPLARARAQLDLVKDSAEAAEKQGGAALNRYEADLTSATRAVQAAEAAERSAAAGARTARKEANAARREALKDVRDRVKAEEDLRKWLDKGFASPEFTVIGNAEASKRATEQARTVFKQAFGDTDLLGDQMDAYNDSQAKRWGEKAEKAAQDVATLNSELRTSAQLADDLATSLGSSFGKAGEAIGQAIRVLGRYGEEQDRIAAEVAAGTKTQADGAKLTANNQLNGMLDLTHAARGLFKEHSRGASAMMAAEKALTVVQLARTAVDVAGGAARMFATLGPYAFPAVAAMVGVMASLGFSAGGSGGSLPKANDGTGTVLGDRDAKSESVKRAIDQLRDVDTLVLSSSREMAASLRSIDGQIGGLASVLVRSGNIDADAGVMQGFKTNAIGSVLKSVVPIFGGALASLFGTKTNVIGSGLYQGGRSIEEILSEGFAAQTYSDVEKTKKFLGITTGKSRSTVYGGAADAAVNDQFTLILRGFNDAILSAAKPLGETTDAIASRVGSFVFTLGKVDLKGLTGEEVQERLTAVFGAAADQMASSAFPGFERFAKVGEGMFETLVRVSLTVEAVTSSFDMLGLSARGLGIDAKVGLAGQFESVGAMTSAADAYFSRFYSQAEQTAAQTARMTGVFTSLGMVMPSTLAGFRNLVDAQDLATTVGQSTYATLLQLAPAFADLQSAMSGAKSAADIMAERTDLERRILELNGDTAAIRALDLAKVDASNRALQSQVWAIQDAQEAAKAAADLSDAWSGVGKTIEDEVRRIRGLSDAGTGEGFAVLQGRFNAAITAGRGGDMEAAKLLPSLSQALLASAEQVATSRQELDRVRAQTAASLESTSVVIAALAKGNPLTSGGAVAAAAAAQAGQSSTPSGGTDNQAAVQGLRDELAAMRRETASALASIASSAGRTTRILENVTAGSGGDAVAVGQAA